MNGKLIGVPVAVIAAVTAAGAIVLDKIAPGSAVVVIVSVAVIAGATVFGIVSILRAFLRGKRAADGAEKPLTAADKERAE